MRVSFLELYNEELFDLLSTTEDNSKLRIFEDSARKVRLMSLLKCNDGNHTCGTCIITRKGLVCVHYYIPL